MSYKIFLDDERLPPSKDNNYYICRTVEEAIALIDYEGWPTHISFDHDLGVDENGKLRKSGYKLAVWIINRCCEEEIALPFSYTVHSMNPVGVANIYNLLESYEHHRWKLVK